MTEDLSSCATGYLKHVSHSSNTLSLIHTFFFSDTSIASTAKRGLIMKYPFNFRGHSSTSDMYFNQDSAIPYISLAWPLKDHVA